MNYIFEYSNIILLIHNNKAKRCFGHLARAQTIREMSSAVEFMKVWLHKEIPSKTHPTAREVNSEFTGLVKVCE